MSLQLPNAEVTRTVARNRLKEGRFILISLSQEKAMVLSDGLIPAIDYKRALIALYDRLGEEVPTNVIKSVQNKLAAETASTHLP